VEFEFCVCVDEKACDVRLRATSKFLLFQLLHVNWRVCVLIDRSVSVAFSAEFNFTTPFFNLYLFICAYKESRHNEQR
jgi:ribosome-associated toxin RatA of RatAB toxin-antitoxin module